MDSYELMYSNALTEIQECMEDHLNEYSVDDLNTIESDLDGWDYCFSIAFGLLGVFLTTNEKIGTYLEDIHKSASGASGKYDSFQKLIGKILYHKDDNIDQINRKFVNRNGDNAWGLFHRLLWGHDILSLNGDNPFYLMIKQKGISGILQALRHLIADTMSHQGLPMPGSSYFDRINESQKTTNYLIDIAKRLSSESGGDIEIEKVYSHIFTLRAQDFSGTMAVKILSDIYLKARNVSDDIRATQFKLICYSVNFFGEALYGGVRQGGIPYINKSLGLLTARELIKLYVSSNKESLELDRKTDLLVDETDRLIQSAENRYRSLNYNEPSDFIDELNNGERNIDNLVDFLAEE